MFINIFKYGCKCRHLLAYYRMKKEKPHVKLSKRTKNCANKWSGRSVKISIQVLFDSYLSPF